MASFHSKPIVGAPRCSFRAETSHSCSHAAEIAASQGQSLYGTRVGDKGIDDAMRFLLAASDNNALVDVYAAANRNPTKQYPVFAPMSQADLVELHGALPGRCSTASVFPAANLPRRSAQRSPSGRGYRTTLSAAT